MSLAFSCKTMGRFHGPCEYFFCKLPMTPFFHAFKTRVPFALEFHLHSASISVVTFQVLLKFRFLLFA
jgi:hypothetical protein